MAIFDQEVIAVEEELISWRRHLHQFPELSFEEHATSAYIEEKLKEFGNIEISRPLQTGVVASVYGSKSGKPVKIGIRADIDALPIQEETDLPFKSQVPGVMHACGHDGHTAILLALAKLLADSREEFCGEVRLIFQHAEELPPGGAIELAKTGAADGVEALLGYHLSSAYDLGTFGLKSGVLTAAVDRFEITLNGKGGHCAYPEQCSDPIVAMAELIMALQTIVSRRIAPTDAAVVSVCTANAGNAYNVIPENAHLSASVRSFRMETRKKIEEEVRKITQSIAKANGIACEIDYENGYPSVENDEGLYQLAVDVIRERFGKEALLQINSIMPGEDFGYLAEGKSGFFVELGTRNPLNNCDQPHHNPRYRLDEEALSYGVQYLKDMVYQLMDGQWRYFSEF